MATLAEFKTRVIAELNRADMGSGGALETVFGDTIEQARVYYANEPFWFNRANGSGSTTASVATIAMPSGIRVPMVVSYLGVPLRKVQLSEIEHLTDTGVPTRWAENEGAIQLWPIPNGVYAIYVYGVAETALPSSSASNIWTVEAYDLLRARVRMILFRDVLRDTEGAELAVMAMDDELDRLRRETRRRGRTGLTTDIPAATAYNINTG